MAAPKKHTFAAYRCTVCKRPDKITKFNKRVALPIERKRYCAWCKAHQIFKAKEQKSGSLGLKKAGAK